MIVHRKDKASCPPGVYLCFLGTSRPGIKRMKHTGPIVGLTLVQMSQKASCPHLQPGPQPYVLAKDSCVLAVLINTETPSLLAV